MNHYGMFYLDGQWVEAPRSPLASRSSTPRPRQPYRDCQPRQARRMSTVRSPRRAGPLPRFSSTRQGRAHRVAGARGHGVRGARGRHHGRGLARDGRAARHEGPHAHRDRRLQASHRHPCATTSSRRAWATNLVRREPIGVCGLITAWNWPVQLICTKLAAALAAGCTVVWKPSEFTPLSALGLAEVMHAAGVPPGVFNLVNGDGPTVGNAISRHADIDLVSFTGSTRAGVLVAEAAAPPSSGSARNWAASPPTSSCRTPTSRPLREMERRARLLQQRPVLPFADAHPGAGAAAGDLVPPGGGGRQGAGRRPRRIRPRPWDRWSTRRSSNVSSSYIQIGLDEGARLSAADRAGPRDWSTAIFIRPTIFANVTPDHDHRQGRDLRPGPGGDCLHHRGAGRRDRQRHAVRPRRLRLLVRPPQGLCHRRADARRPHLLQRRAQQLRGADGRLQAVRQRPRDGRVRSRGVPGGQVDDRLRRTCKP